MEQQRLDQELFHNVDEEPDDLWLSAYVRRHFEIEAAEMHAKLTEDMPDPVEQARLEGWLDSLLCKQKLRELWKKLYGGIQKAAVFLVVLAAGFVMVFLDVEAVQNVVLENLQPLNPYYVALHMEPVSRDEEPMGYEKLKFDWLPSPCRAEIGKEDEAIYIRSGSRIVGAVLYTKDSIAFTEPSACRTNIELSGYTIVTLAEEAKSSWCGIIAILPDGSCIGIESVGKGTFGLTTTEIIKILQNIKLKE